jgi:hypothetical protein
MPPVPMALNPLLGASLLVLSLLQAPGGQALEPLETKWRESIEADLRNGDPTGQVCTKAKTRASISDDVAFKNWAYGIARRTCPQGAVGGKAPPLQPHTWCCPLLTAHDARIVARGHQLRISTGACVMIFN